MHWAVEHGEEINIHFHTFEPSNLRELLERMRTGGNTQRAPASRQHAHARPSGAESETADDVLPARPLLPRFKWEIVDFAEYFPAQTPNGVLAILRVDKGWRARADAEVFRLRTLGNPRGILRDDAQPFAEWSAKPPVSGGAC
jgi:hypothetical protein